MGNDDLKPDEQAAVDAFNASRIVDELCKRNGWERSPPCPDCGSYMHFECGGYPGLSITRSYFDGSKMVYEGISPHDVFTYPDQSR